MARSRKRSPFTGMTNASSEKADKQVAHRRIRKRTRNVLVQALDSSEARLPEVRALSNPWSMAKDGKLRFDPRKYPELLRK